MQAQIVGLLAVIGVGGCGMSSAPDAAKVEGLPPVLEAQRGVSPASREIQFQRVQIGFTLDQVREAWQPDHDVRCAPGERVGYQVCLLDRVGRSDQAERVPAIFEFDQTGRLIRVDRRWAEQDFDARVDVAVGRFGMPQEDTGLSRPLGLRSRAESRIVVWRSSESVLTARWVLSDGPSWSTWRLEPRDTNSERNPAPEAPYGRAVQRILSEQAAMTDDF